MKTAILILLAAALPVTLWAQAPAIVRSGPLTLGETFTLQSKILGEARPINVYLPPGDVDSRERRLPVLYMLDGGMAEDFLHVAGLVQVSVANGTMRPFILVGIENVVRRRDLTGPTNNPEDKRLAPLAGGSAAFRRFLRSELLPVVKERYRPSNEAVILGESLAGWFVLETLFLEPDLFNTYIAFDPSLWWNRGELVKRAAERMPAIAGRTVYFACGSDSEMVQFTRQLADAFAYDAPRNVAWRYETFPDETHATIYHPAALRAFRYLFKP
jgi:hypothetical protein